MKRIQLRRPSTATTVAFLALMVALSQTAWGESAVSSAKRLITGKQIARNAITSKQVKNRSLLALDFKAGQLPAGPRGPKGDTGAQGDPGPATGPAGGVLSGNYPNPGLATTAPGVAIAGVSSTGMGANPPALVWFNRFGGAPTITRNSTGSYEVTFPGLAPNVASNVIVTANGPNDDQVSATSTGGKLVVTVHTAAGALADDFFSVVLMSASPTG